MNLLKQHTVLQKKEMQKAYQRDIRTLQKIEKHSIQQIKLHFKALLQFWEEKLQDEPELIDDLKK